MKDIDPVVMAALSDGRRRAKDRARTPAQRRKAQQDRARVKATYDLPEEIKRAVAALATELDVSTSSLAAYLLAHALAAYERGEIDVSADLEPSASPRARWRLRVGETEE